jgi:CHAT domain-containing protein
LEDSVYSNPPIQKLIIGKNTPHANYLKFKAEAAWNLYEQNPDQAYLRIAQEAYALLHQLIQKSFREADLTESSSLQSTLAFTMDGILKTGLAYQELSQPENLNTVFEYLQKSKGLSINLNLGRDFQEIDTLLIQVRSEITALEKQIFWTQQGAQDFNLDSLNEQLIAKYDQLKLRENDSNNSLVETINVKTLQQELKENQLFLELYQAASGVYTLAVHRNGIRLFHQPNPENLNVLLQNSRKGLSDWSWIKLNQDSSRQYIYEAGRLAYTSSLADALEWFPAVQKIVLAPSNQLANLPYAIALPTAFDYQSQSFQDWPFLLKSRSLGYAYSATIWLRQRNQNRAFRRAKMAVFAPAYEDNTTSDDELVANLQRSGNWQLPFAQLEAKEISTLMGAKLYQGAKASRSTFLEEMDRFQILHLAMHAYAEPKDPKFSRLYFSQDSSDQYTTLLATELYEKNLGSELVVLSACNTGWGEASPSEGLLSLGHAFSTAGVSASLMTLWPVADASTQELMLDFYQSLNEKQTKMEALRKAKLNYLENADSDLAAHPYFWAAFQLYGDPRPIKRNSYWGLILLGLGIIIAFFVLVRKRQAAF